MHKYRELNVWKKSIKLAVDVYNLTAQFPSSERYELTSQMRRAAVSVPSNIAEGAGRNTNNEFAHFLGISNGSSYELVTQLIISAELGLSNYDEVNPIINELEEVQKMTYSLIDSIKKPK
jgi:four helix bundle protein